MVHRPVVLGVEPKELANISALSAGSLKIDVTPLEDISIEFAKLKPSRYTIVRGDEVKNDIGLIAEDVLLSFPEFVRCEASTGISTGKISKKDLEYEKLVVLCIQQIQQLKEQNAILADKVAILEKR